MTTLATRLRAAREARGFSQEDLARLALLSPDALARLERGSDPKASALVELARALEVSADHLLGLGAGEDGTPAPVVQKGSDLTPDMRRLLRSARQLGSKELNLVAQLADALLAKQAAP